MKIIVVGAGIIGALTAYRLAEKGAQVTLIDAGQPAGAASGTSFGWINASFYANGDHFNLRHAAMFAHCRLSEALGTQAIRWQACLCWEQEGDAFDEQYKALQTLGYAVRIVDRSTFAELEPAVEPPERALMFDSEGAVDLAHLAQDAVDAACELGVKLIAGVPVTGIETRSGSVTGVRWSGGVIPADRVVIAAGVATERLLAGVDVELPMLDRPGLILKSQKLPPLLAHILVSPRQEMRQDPDGRIIAPTAAAHQGDTTERMDENPETLADEAAQRVGALLGLDLHWESVTLAARPVPKDGLPVMGPCGPDGLYVATMHSGATLAPLAAELVSDEVLEKPLSNAQAALIAPYRPQRFIA